MFLSMFTDRLVLAKYNTGFFIFKPKADMNDALVFRSFTGKASFIIRFFPAAGQAVAP
jgi:putative heme iron utilization protein